MCGLPAGERTADAVRRELGWSPVRDVPPAFAETVERAEAAMLRLQRGGAPTEYDEAARDWDAVCGDAGFANAPVSFRVDALNRCGVVHLGSYLISQREADEAAALSCWERGLAIAPPDGPEQARLLHNQGNTRLNRYRRTGRLADLQAAIPALQAAADHAHAEQHLDLYLYSLGQALISRYQREGTLADLESAIIYGERSLEQMGSDSQRRGLVTGMVGDWYRQRFERTRNEVDIQRAIAMLDGAVARADRRSRPFRLTNLGSALLSCYGRSGVRADLDRAVEVQREAVSLTAPDDVSLPIRLNNLANSLSALRAASADHALLDEATETYARVVGLTPVGDPFRPSRLYNLGRTLQQRHDLLGRPEDAMGATAAFREACQSGFDYSLEWALGAATAWGEWAERLGDWPQAAEAYDFGLQAINALYETQLLAESQASWLREARDLAARAAYVQARNGQLEQAVVAIEHGRARALNDALTRQEALREAIPAADREALQALMGSIEVLHGEVGRAAPDGARGFPAIASELRQAREALSRRIDQVRAAFPNFMPAAMSFQGLADLVETVGQPLAYLLTTPSGSLALVVVPGDAGVRVLPVWMDDFTSGDLAALMNGHGDGRGYLYGSVEAEPEEFDAILEAVLPVLAGRLMGPLARSLSALGVRRARLVPTGTLGLLPLHAVVPPDLTLSYVPSARALRAASLDEDHALTSPGFLGVGDPARGPEEQLDFARLEVERIAGLFRRPGRRGEVLPPERATRGDIATLLAGTTHLHFACHGRFEVDRPLQSALYLAGEERLTLEALLDGQLDVSALRLVVLSACQTGLIDFLNVPDEVVGFPAGFLQAGVPAVISTLWPVDDASTAILLERFYRCYLDGLEPGLALHAAQDWLRTATAAEMDLAGAYEAAFEASGRHRHDALDAAAYYRANPAVTPFSPQSYWAAFYLSGV